MGPKILSMKNFESKELGSKTFGVQKSMGPKIMVAKTFWPKKDVGSKKLMASKIRSKSLVKIGSVTAEILLILTNVARTNVDWTNVTMTVGIC